MKLFVGLGNPGAAYARHRHNVGFMAVERIAARHELGPWKKRFYGLASDGTIAGRRIALLKPQTYMNDSGRSVQDMQRFFKVADADVVVFHDELDLAPGKLRVKRGGGNAGHNGLRSITAHIGNEYQRVRIGIGHPGSKHLVSGYVLNDFAKADATWLEPLLDAIADAAGRLAAGEEARFVSDVARATMKAAANEEPDTDPGEGKGARPPPPTRQHPAGERRAKSLSAFAETLQKWLKGRGQGD
jgi:PTH1 family peptidyl-tRNA hydrolase